MKILHRLLFAAIFLVAMQCSALVVTVHGTDAADKAALGTVTFEAHQSGVLITPNLHGLAPGPHGFHLHAKPSCDEHGMAAGGHFDPAGTGVHLGPYAQGHLGDLPVLWVDSEGKATTPVLAPRLSMSDLKGVSLMIHEGGDNYSDQPVKLGGGGAREGCAVILQY